ASLQIGVAAECPALDQVAPDHDPQRACAQIMSGLWANNLDWNPSSNRVEQASTGGATSDVASFGGQERCHCPGGVAPGNLDVQTRLPEIAALQGDVLASFRQRSRLAHPNGHPWIQ